MRSNVWDFVWRRGADRTTADDVVGETYLIAWRRIEDVPIDRRAALQWLCGVARRLLSRIWRATHRQEAVIERFGSHLQRQRQDLVPLPEDGRLLVDAWLVLSKSDRRLLVLAGWLGHTNDELAKHLGCTPAAAATRLSRARMRLNDALQW